MANQANKWIKEARKRLIILWGLKCFVCGTSEKLEFAHINDTELRGMGRGRKERYYDVIKNPDSYVLLCKNCHKDFDML